MLWAACVEEGAGQALLWQSSALPCTPPPQSLYPSLAEAASPWHTRGNAPCLPLEPLAQLQSDHMTPEVPPGGDGQGYRGYLRLNTRQMS